MRMTKQFIRKISQTFPNIISFWYRNFRYIEERKYFSNYFFWKEALQLFVQFIHIKDKRSSFLVPYI